MDANVWNTILNDIDSMQFIEFIAMRLAIQFNLTIGGQLAQLLQWPCYVILRGSLLCRVEWRTSQGLVWKMARRVQQPTLPPLPPPTPC